MPTYYPLSQSPFYKLKNKKKLAELLGQNLTELTILAHQNDNYNVYNIGSKSVIDHPYFQKKPRKIQEVKPHLNAIHRRILSLLRRIQAPNYLHSAIKKKSYKTNAQVHDKSRVLYKVDIKNFYESVTFGRVYHLFNSTFQCSEDVAHLLTRLCVYRRTLATGSCLSPLLSFWANLEMFERLAAYSLSKNLRMSLYVDDLTFSGQRVPKNTCFEIDKIIASYAYKPHKQKLYPANKAKIITGLALCNGRLDIPNKRRGKVRVLLTTIAGENNIQRKERLCKSLIGMIYEAAQFNRKYAMQISKEARKKCPCISQSLKI